MNADNHSRKNGSVPLQTECNEAVTPQQPSLGVMLHITPQGEQSPAQTYTEFTELVQAIEGIGFDEAWVTEHHFTPHSLTPSPLLMMGHFLAHTQTLKLGSAAVLIGFHNPIEVAEQLAVLNTLHPNRLLCGFAKGGPFESQNAAFKANSELSRERMEEAVPALLGLLNSEKDPEKNLEKDLEKHPDTTQDQPSPHTHQGKHYQWQGVALHPHTVMPSSRFLLATSHPSSVRLAAENDLGLMAAQFWSQDKIAENIQQYQQAHSKGDAPDMMAARGLFIDDDPVVAREKALAHIHAFRTQKSQLWGQHKGPMHNMDDDQMLSRALCGTVEQVRAQTHALLALGVTRLGLNPLTTQHECRLLQLERFYEEVWSDIVVQTDKQNAENKPENRVGSGLKRAFA